MSDARLAATVARFTERNRAGDLARAASLAVRVESQLLRRLRLALLPGLDAAAEADLWFSPLVGARDSTSFTWAPGVAAILRAELKQRFAARDPARRPVDPAIVRQHVVAAHATASPLVQLEEELAWLAFTDAPAAAIERALGRVVRAFEHEPGAADDLAAWAMRALPALPPAARATAAAWQLGLAASTRHGVAATLGAAPPADWLAHVARNVLVERGRTRLRVERQGGALWIVPAPDASEREPDTLDVPTTRPLWLEVSSRDGRRAAIEVGPERTRLDARGGDVLRNALGEAWTLEELATVPGADADAASAFVIGWLAVRVPDDRGGWPAVRDQVLADLARAAQRLPRIDAVILFASTVDDVALSELGVGLTQALDQEAEPAVLEVKTSVDSEPGAELDVEGERVSVDGPIFTAVGDLGQFRTFIRRSEDAATWPMLRDAVLRAMVPSYQQANVSMGPPPSLVLALGRDTCLLGEHRYPAGSPSLLVFDPATPWSPPAPALRGTVPAPLWGSGASTYTLGCVRTSAPESPSAPGAGQVIEIERTLRDGVWRERAARSAAQPMPHAGDRDLGWAANDIAILVGDYTDPRFDALVERLTAWFVQDGGMGRARLLVLESSSPPDRLPALLSSERLVRRLWLVVTESSAARRLGREVVAGVLHEMTRRESIESLVGFVDPVDLYDLRATIGARGLWLATTTTRDTPPRATVVEAGVEALLGSARVLDAIPMEAVERHLTARCGDGFWLRTGELSGALAPAPRHVRVDLTALRRVDGGRERGAPSLAGGDRGRVVFVVGASAPSRSAWIDRFLRAAARTSEDDTTAGGPVLGWSPAREPFDAALARARALLVPWAHPLSSMIGGADDAAELAWRIEGANALYVLDGLDHDPPPSELRFVVAATRNRAGRVVVSAPSRPTWLSPSDYHVVDLDDLPLPDELSALGRRAFQPTVAAWIDELATWGHDQPVLVAGALVAALSTSGRWRDTPESTRALRLVARAARALADGDPESMLADVRDVAAIAIAALGLDACARLLGAAPAQQAQGTFAAGPPPDVA